jgi:DNA-binding MarR family transcriptional regulator
LSTSRDERQTDRRRELIQALTLAGRESSAATVLFHTAIAERAGLAPSDTKTIDILLRLGPLTAGELADYTGLATASVTSLIDRLEKKGFVRRVRDPKDRRRVIVEPVADRVAESEALFGSIQQAFEELLGCYTEDQLETVLDFMRRAAQRTREVTAALTRAADAPPAGEPVSPKGPTRI